MGLGDTGQIALEGEDWLSKIKAIRDDPWAFVSILNTLDPADKKNPIKKFPVHLEYLKFYTRIWEKKKKILVPKSRRMRMTWINIALYLWDTCWHVGRHNAVVSKKEDDSNELVKKAEFLLSHIEETDLPKEFIPKYEVTYNKLYFPEINSTLQGFASGADQLRQFTFSGIFADELAFWSDAEQMYSASVPTLEGGGRFTGVSSPAPGFFKRLVEDELDQSTSGAA